MSAEPIVKPHEMPDACRATPLGKPDLPCGRTHGHKGSHIHFGDNGTTGWGNPEQASESPRPEGER